MSDRSAIEWTDATWNPVGGCSIKSPACVPCYAQQLAGTRLKNHPLYAGTTSPSPKDGRPIFNGLMTKAEVGASVWSWPVHWRGAKNPKLGPGMPSLIFVGDMSDLFHEHRPRNDIEAVITVGLCSRHILQLLTKRADRMRDLFETLPQRQLDRQCHSGLDRAELPFPNFWLGTSAERQKEFDERWPHLRRLADLGFVVFISYEPAMGPLKLPADFLALGRRAWLIAGGCSGHRAWPAHPDWFRRVRDDCGAAGVPLFFKQWGEWRPGCPAWKIDATGPRAAIFYNGETNCTFFDAPPRQMARYGCTSQMMRVGKKAAGRLLDGREWNEFPAVKQNLGAAP